MSEQTEPRTKDEWITWINDPARDWSAPDGKSVAVLYSGYRGQNGKWANEDCQPADSSRYCIEQTAAGDALNRQELYKSLPKEDADEVWKAASTQFAQEVDGPVETHFVVGQDPRGA